MYEYQTVMLFQYVVWIEHDLNVLVNRKHEEYVKGAKSPF